MESVYKLNFYESVATVGGGAFFVTSLMLASGNGTLLLETGTRLSAGGGVLLVALLYPIGLAIKLLARSVDINLLHGPDSKLKKWLVELGTIFIKRSHRLKTFHYEEGAKCAKELRYLVFKYLGSSGKLREELELFSPSFFLGSEGHKRETMLGIALADYLESSSPAYLAVVNREQSSRDIALSLTLALLVSSVILIGRGVILHELSLAIIAVCLGVFALIPLAFYVNSESEAEGREFVATLSGLAHLRGGQLFDVKASTAGQPCESEGPSQ